MGNRVIRADILESEKVNKLSWGGEVFYRRLMSILDDYGYCDGRPSILRSKMYPLKIDKVSEPDIVKWLTECVDAGLVRIYQVEDKPYIEFFKFNQTIRVKKHRFPPPSDNCKQMQADDLICRDGVGVESNPDSKPESERTGVAFWEELIFDEKNARWITDLGMVNPGLDLKKCFRACFNYHANAPNPPIAQWQWQQKLSTWCEIESKKHHKPVRKKSFDINNL